MPFRANGQGVAIAVCLRPGASANRIDGIQSMADGKACLSVRVTAVPEKGKANQAMIKILAKAWHVPRGNLAVIAGARKRHKTLLLQGEPSAHMRMLKQWRQGFAPD
jgi:hypothetical protein|tara:strand:+ start:77 stop:397 length:321 start_codon:yes stop_codon:yes gene_type:complete